MKKYISTSALLIAASALFVASSASAHQQEEFDYKNTCEQRKSNAAVAGGFIGAGLGGAAGKALAAAQVRPEGIVLGAVVGGILGANVGKETVYCGEDHVYTQNGGRSYGDNSQGAAYNGHLNQWGYDAGWYVPSAQSYYGQERAVYGAYQYSGAQQVQYSTPNVQVMQYSTGVQYVPAPAQIVPAPIQPAPVIQYMPPQYTPQQPPCGYWVCQ